MFNGKAMRVHLIAGLIKKHNQISVFHHIQMSRYFPKPYETFGGYINVKVPLSNQVTKTDIQKYFTC